MLVSSLFWLASQVTKELSQESLLFILFHFLEKPNSSLLCWNVYGISDQTMRNHSLNHTVIKMMQQACLFHTTILSSARGEPQIPHHIVLSYAGFVISLWFGNST